MDAIDAYAVGLVLGCYFLMVALLVKMWGWRWPRWPKSEEKREFLEDPPNRIDQMILDEDHRLRRRSPRL